MSSSSVPCSPNPGAALLPTVALRLGEGYSSTSLMSSNSLRLGDGIGAWNRDSEWHLSRPRHQGSWTWASRKGARKEWGLFSPNSCRAFSQQAQASTGSSSSWWHTASPARVSRERSGPQEGIQPGLQLSGIGPECQGLTTEASIGEAVCLLQLWQHEEVLQVWGMA